MKINFKILLLLVGLLAFQSKVLSQRNDYSGTWKINLQKSKFEADWAKGLTEGEFKIIQIGVKFKWSRYFIIKGRKSKMKLNLIADGKVRRKKMLLFKTRLEWIGDNLKAKIFRNGFSDEVDYKLGDGKNELIIDEVFVGRPQDYHNHYVLDKIR
ncbi:MAG: hypothetical protein JZU47_00785 [Prolixibacteraceae bacterium]|nr:hypothetical protein [Prolixibacteraceae bacterium]